MKALFRRPTEYSMLVKAIHEKGELRLKMDDVAKFAKFEMVSIPDLETGELVYTVKDPSSADG